MRSNSERTSALVMAGISYPFFLANINNYISMILQSGTGIAVVSLLAVILVLLLVVIFNKIEEDKNGSSISEGTDADGDRKKEGDETTEQDGVETGLQNPPQPDLPPGPDQTAEPSGGDTEISDSPKSIIATSERQVKTEFLLVSEGDDSLEDAEKVSKSDLRKDMEKDDGSDPMQDAQEAKD